MTKLIADACANHLGDRRIMQAMIEAAANAGVDIIKWQSFKASKLRADWPDYSNALQYYTRHQLSESDHYYILEQCFKNKIEMLTTVFDLETVDFLADELGLKQVKIASPDANNLELIDKCVDKFDCVIISTGMLDKSWLEDLLHYRYHYNKKIRLLHCVSKYPTDLSSVNMSQMIRLFDGFSDHTIGLDASKFAIAVGAEYVERHFTLSRDFPGKDQFFSSTPQEFSELVEWKNKVETMRGTNVRELSAEELELKEKYNRRFWGE